LNCDSDLSSLVQSIQINSTSLASYRPREKKTVHLPPPSNVLSACWPDGYRIIMASPAVGRSSGNIDPSVLLEPDTSHASEPSDLPSTIHPANSPANNHPTNTREQLPPLSIRSRAETLSSPSSTTSSSPVRRKPLPKTASPLATRYSSGEHLAATLERPEQTFSRPYTIDSPTLYEFPPTSKTPSAPASEAEQSLSTYITSTSLKQYCFNGLR
jgi:hypothetical protein